jgi:hypothetical protein
MQARLPVIERIWRVRGGLALDETLSPAEAFDRLGPLFATQGTQVAIEDDTLVYRKTNPAAQDKLATFTSGILHVAPGKGETQVRWELGSTALFLTFLAPLGFLAFAQFAHFVNELEKPAIIAKMAEEEAKKEAEKDRGVELHWIDQMMGVPAPEKPGEKDEKKKEEERGAGGGADSGEAEGEEEEELPYNHSPTTAYVLAGIFALIFLVGRVLEPYLVMRTFRAHLRRPAEAEFSEKNNKMEADSKLAPNGGGIHGT